MFTVDCFPFTEEWKTKKETIYVEKEGPSKFLDLAKSRYTVYLSWDDHCFSWNIFDKALFFRQ